MIEHLQTVVLTESTKRIENARVSNVACFTFEMGRYRYSNRAKLVRFFLGTIYPVLKRSRGCAWGVSGGGLIKSNIPIE